MKEDETWKAFMDLVSKLDDLTESVQTLEMRFANFLNVYRQDRFIIENILEKSDKEITGLEKYTSNLSKELNTLSETINKLRVSKSYNDDTKIIMDE